MAQAQRQLSAQERSILFAQATRQNYQMLPSKQVTGENSTVTFDLPKVRLLSKIFVEVSAVATLKSTTGTNIALKPFGVHNILRRVSLDLNNGFSPFMVPGRDLYLYNLNRLNPDVLFPQSNIKGITSAGTTSSAGGNDQQIKFTVCLPVTLNDQATTGLILLQNPETTVQLTLDVAKLEDAYNKNISNGDVVTFKSMTVTPMVETFSIPPIPEAFPDISVLKLVSSKANSFAGNGQNIVPLQTGTIYRKLVLYFEDANGAPLTDLDFSGNIELVFNQADVPYSIKPSLLSSLNHSQLGYPLPDGVYVFDFSNQGLPNGSGARDYIDTEKLTEFWVRFSSTKGGKLTAVTETLSRLRA
jgi:hypothetical protein